MRHPSEAERDLLRDGYDWIDDNADEMLGFLESIVARPSVSGTEGTHDDPDTTVGYLWNFLDDCSGGIRREFQRVSVDNAAESGEPPRENVYTVIEGDGDGNEGSREGFVALTHTDVVPPGRYEAWPDDDPFAVSRGTVERIGETELTLAVDGCEYDRTIRENLARVWDQRGFESATALVGRGVYDNKACSAILVGSLLAFRAGLDSQGMTLDGDLIHGHLVDEEQDQLGVKNMVGWEDNDDWLGDHYDDPSVFGAVVLEGQYGFVPVVGHRGGINLTVTAHGEAVHGSTPDLGRNAATAMAKLLVYMDTPAFQDDVDDLFIDDELLGEFTVAPGTTVTTGDVSVNPSTGTVERDGGAEYGVPDWCQATVDCRVPRWVGYPEDAGEFHDRFLDRVATVASDVSSGVEFDVESNMFFQPVALGKDRDSSREHSMVRTAQQSTQDLLGYGPDIAVAPGATDAWVYAHATGGETLVEYGPAGALSHEPLEYVERQQVVDGAKVLLNLAVRQIGASRT